MSVKPSSLKSPCAVDGTVRLFNLGSDGNQFRSEWTQLSAGTWKLTDARPVAGDFDGDGIDDVVAVVDDRAGGWKAWLFRSDGTQFAAPALWRTQAAGTYTWAGSRTLAGDVTGDGKADLVIAHSTGATQTAIRVHTSTGTSFGAPTQWWAGTDWTSSSARYVAADIDGDSDTDLIAQYDLGGNTQMRVFTSSGSAFTLGTTPWWDSDTGSADGWEPRKVLHLTAGDFDANGDVDLGAVIDCCEPGVRELWTFPRSGNAFGQVAKRGVAQATTTSKPSAHYKSEEGTGTTLTDAQGEVPATVSGATWNTNGRTVGADALQFDGVDDYATPNQPLIRTDRSFTVMAWVKLTGTTGSKTILTQAGTNRPGFYLQYYGAEAKWRFLTHAEDVHASPSFYAVKAAVAPRLNKWTHVAGVYDADAGQNKLYIDGVLAGAVARPIVWNAGGAFQIGRATSPVVGPNERFQGGIDDVRAFDLALNSTEIGEIARTSSPAGRWRFDAGAHTADSSGNGRTLTLAGGATSAAGRYGNGLKLDGTDDAATTPKPLRTTSSYTVCAWAKADAGQGLAWRGLLSQEVTVSSGFWIRTGPDAQWQMAVHTTNTAYSSLAGTTTVVAGTWYHVCGAYDAGTNQAFLFVNGRLEAARLIDGQPQEADGALNIGRYKYNNSNSYWPGTIDDVRIYNGAIIDTTHITALMNGN